ncbi:MAG TPA: TrkA C-terminal domain-containing protein [Clostridia bacterium]|nr:TrkA C-terminal domain-containing protein [Clostridia bacterium]
MKRTEPTVLPRYLKIAVDIAARIVSGNLLEGEKLRGRSVLSSEYNVSPETIRRSMSLLSDKKVVKINAGSGIVVLSKENAVEFISNFNADEVLSQMKNNLSKLLKSRTALDEEIAKTTKQIADMYKYRRSDLINPVEIILPENSYIIKKSIGDLQIWHHTGATVIGIIRTNSIIISPGPYFAFESGDRVLIVGDEHVIERFNAYINQDI